AAIDAQPDPQMSGDGHPKPAEPPADPAESPAEPAGPAKPKPVAGLILGGGLLPTPLLAELINNGAKVRWVHKPDAAPESGYRP
ncbi:hypothetical protein BST21_24095, partial [Mycolicibacterium celeriflavum]